MVDPHLACASGSRSRPPGIIGAGGVSANFLDVYLD
jgi:hypothetical protein